MYRVHGFSLLGRVEHVTCLAHPFVRERVNHMRYIQEAAAAFTSTAATPTAAVHRAYSSDGMYVNFSVRLILFSSFLSLTFGSDCGVLSFKHQAQRPQYNTLPHT